MKSAALLRGNDTATRDASLFEAFCLCERDGFESTYNVSEGREEHASQTSCPSYDTFRFAACFMSGIQTLFDLKPVLLRESLPQTKQVMSSEIYTGLAH
jgi:hypothetical protein